MRDDQPTCDFHFDEDEHGWPCGKRCGEPATKEIDWQDGRWSRTCDEHAAEVSRTVTRLIRSIRPLAPQQSARERAGGGM